MRYLIPILALCLVPAAFAQPAQVQVNADCVIAFNFTIAGSTGGTSGFNNIPVGCNSWQIAYTSNGFSGLTLTVQSALNTSATPQTGACVPGSWGTLGGTATFGANPNTSTTAASALIQSYAANFAPCVRVTLSGLTGSGNVGGILLGYRAAGTAGTSGGGGAGSAVNLTQVASVNVASDSNGGIVPGGVSTAFADGVSNTGVIPQADNAGTPAAAAARVFPMNFNGSTWDRNFICPLNAKVALSGTGYTQIIALSGSTVIRLCKVFVTSSSGGSPVLNTITLGYGTGSNCASGTTDLLAAGGVAGIDEDFGGALRTAAGNAFCVKEATANSDPVTVTYAQY
jgi:hypothetical protein